MSRFFSDRVKKLVIYFGLYESFFGLSEKKRQNKYYLWEENLFSTIRKYNYFLQLDSKIYHKKIVVQSAGCALAYFCGRQKKKDLLAIS